MTQDEKPKEMRKTQEQMKLSVELYKHSFACMSAYVCTIYISEIPFNPKKISLTILCCWTSVVNDIISHPPNTTQACSPTKSTRSQQLLSGCLTVEWNTAHHTETSINSAELVAVTSTGRAPVYARRSCGAAGAHREN